TVGQKLKAGMGYTDGSGTPSPALLSAIEYTDQSIGKLLNELEKRKLLSSTAIIVTAKHGQAPMDASKRQIVDEKLIPNLLNGIQKDLVAEATGDDIFLVWLRDQSKTAEAVS